MLDREMFLLLPNKYLCFSKGLNLVSTIFLSFQLKQAKHSQLKCSVKVLSKHFLPWETVDTTHAKLASVIATKISLLIHK